VCGADSRKLRQLAAKFRLCGQHIAANPLPPFTAFCRVRWLGFFNLYHCKEMVSIRQLAFQCVHGSIISRSP
jgi:hypothetical protein